MPTYWDFREMLDIHPESDDRCVAINKGSGTRCGNRGKAGRANLDVAGHLLDILDRTKSSTECCQNFDDLAYLTMCGRSHRNMPEIRAERCRHWESEVEVYVATEARKKARALKLKKALKARKAEEEAAGESENEERVRVNPRVRKESSRTQEKARRQLFSSASRADEPSTNTNDPFINSNEVTPRPQSELKEDHTAMGQHSSTVRKSSKDKISNASELKKQKETQNARETQLATSGYGLPSPPDSLLSPRPLKRQGTMATQSPPHTPTKVSVSAIQASATLGLSSSSSASPANLPPNNTDGEEEPKPVNSLPEFPSLPSGLETFDQDPVSAQTSESPISVGLLSARNRFDQESPILASSTSAPIDNTLSQGSLTKNSLPDFDTTSLPQTEYLLLSSEESDGEPSSDLETGIEAPSSIRDESLTASFDDFPMIEFESDSEVASASSDPDTMSKRSFAGTAPQIASTMPNCFTPDQEKAQSETEDEEDEDEESSQEVMAPLSSIEKVEKVMGGSAEEMIAASKSNLVTDVDEIQNVPGLSTTTLKTNPRQFDGLLSPDASPEPHQTATATPIVVEGSTPISDKPKESRAPIDVDSRSVKEILKMGEATLKPLGMGDKEASEITDGRSQTPKTPTKTQHSNAESLSTPGATPEPYERPDNSISLISVEHTSVVGTTSINTPLQIDEQKEEVSTPKHAFELSQPCNKGVHLVYEGIIIAPKLSKPDLTNKDVGSSTDYGNAIPAAITELPKSGQHCTLLVAEDTISDEVDSRLPEPDQKTLSISEECEVDPKTEYEQTTLLNEALPVTMEDANLSLLAIEPINDSLPQKTESFGHALIDPSERRYKTRFSEHHSQVLLATPHGLKDMHTFSEIELDIQPFAAITPPKLSIGGKPPKSHEDSSPTPSINGEYILPGEYFEWETGRGMPKQRRGLRLRKEALRVVRESITTVSEAVRWKARRSSIMPRG